MIFDFLFKRKDPFVRLMDKGHNVFKSFNEGVTLVSKRNMHNEEFLNTLERNKLTVNDYYNQTTKNMDFLFILLLISISICDFVLAYNSLDAVLISLPISQMFSLICKIVFAIAIVIIELSLSMLHKMNPDKKIGLVLPFLIAGFLPFIGLSGILLNNFESFYLMTLIVPAIFSIALHTSLILYVDSINKSIANNIIRLKLSKIEKSVEKIEKELVKLRQKISDQTGEFAIAIDTERYRRTITDETVGRIISHVPRNALLIYNYITANRFFPVEADIEVIRYLPELFPNVNPENVASTLTPNVEGLYASRNNSAENQKNETRDQTPGSNSNDESYTDNTSRTGNEENPDNSSNTKEQKEYQNENSTSNVFEKEL